MGKVSGSIPEISHLMNCPFGRPAFLFRLARRIVSGRFTSFVVGWWQRGQVGGSGRSTLVTLQTRLEESGDPLEGRGRLVCGLVLVNLAGSLAHDREDGGGDDSGWWSDL